jgi:putative ABC transport system substrate-binding protein
MIGLLACGSMPFTHFGGEFTVAGGLISYGVLTGKVLKGQRPPIFPVEEPNIYELLVNQKTATALNLTIPSLIFVRADGTVG